MISIAVSPLCELVRWALDFRGMPYVEENHVPVFHAIATSRAGKTNDVPVTVVAEGALRNAKEAVAYLEARARDDRKLVPRDGAADVLGLYEEFYQFGFATRAWAYAYMLPHKQVTIASWTVGAPAWERMLVPLFYPLVAKMMGKSLEIDPTTITKREQEIEATLARVDALLADGRPFLHGQTLTLADVAFAVFASPAILPPNCPSPLPAIENVPPPMRASIERWRARPCGQFAARLYRDFRPPKPANVPSPNRSGFGTRLAAKLTSAAVLRPVLGFLRRLRPVVAFGNKILATSHAAVTDVLARDTDFTLSQVNAPRIDRLDGPFMLGMDRSPEYDREKAALRQAVRPDDLERVRGFVAASALELIDAARTRGRIDVVSSYARPVAARVVASYFGMPGPDEPTLMRWMRTTFQDVFLNVGGDAKVTAAAAVSGKELRQFEDALIAAREADPSSGGDDILTRLVRMESGWLDHDAVRRNLGGMIVGAVDTTAKFVVLAMNELVARPRVLAEARAAALANDIDAVRRFTYEAVRFDPHNSFLLRYAPRATELAGKPIPANSYVLISVLSAMFDPAAYPEPDAFRTDRAQYLHFGDGMHTCFGVRINAVQIPELVAGLLRLPNLRRAPGASGRVAWDGPFPEHFVLAFDT
jgi:cytochrome P450